MISILEEKDKVLSIKRIPSRILLRNTSLLHYYFPKKKVYLCNIMMSSLLCVRLNVGVEHEGESEQH